MVFIKQIYYIPFPIILTFFATLIPTQIPISLRFYVKEISFFVIYNIV